MIFASSALFTVCRRQPARRCLARRLLIVALLLALTVIPPLAGATLPDSVWIAGIYDDADYDALLAAQGDDWLGVSPLHVIRLLPLGLTVRVRDPARCAPGDTWACLSRAPPPR